MDDQEGKPMATKLAKKEQDKGRRRPGRIQKKCLYILFDPNIKTFEGWKAAIEAWSLITCERFIE
jgi:hypothetical protein